MTSASSGLICAVPDLCSAASSVTGDVVKDAAGGVLDVFTSALSSAASWLVEHVINLIDTTTSVQLNGGWFPERVDAMGNVLLLVVLPILMAASTGAVLRQDLRRLARVWAVGLPVALTAGLAGVQMAGWAMAATDQMCQVISVGPSGLSKGFTDLIVANLTSGEPQFVQMVISGLVIAGTVAVWLELVVRAAAIYIAVFFMPLALVGYIWPATASMAKRAVELVVALVLSKFVIVASLTLGLAAVNQGNSADSAVAGGAILLIAGFAPFCLLRLAPVVETAAIAHLEGLSRRPLRAAARTATSAAAAPTHPVSRLLLSGGASTGGSPPASAAVRPVAVPTHQADFPLGNSSQAGESGG